jgi:hypothetical protein
MDGLSAARLSLLETRPLSRPELLWGSFVLVDEPRGTLLPDVMVGRMLSGRSSGTGIKESSRVDASASRSADSCRDRGGGPSGVPGWLSGHPEGADNLGDLLVFVDHASGEVTSSDAEFVDVDHVVW